MHGGRIEFKTKLMRAVRALRATRALSAMRAALTSYASAARSPAIVRGYAADPERGGSGWCWLGEGQT